MIQHGLRVGVVAPPGLPPLLALCRQAGEDRGSAPGAVAHAVRNVLPGAGHRKAPGAVKVRCIGCPISANENQVLLRVRELAAGLEATPCENICFVEWVSGMKSGHIARILLQTGIIVGTSTYVLKN